MTTGRWALSLPIVGVPLRRQTELVRLAESVGFTDGWSSEVDGVDAFSPLIAGAMVTQQMRFGTALVNVFTRGPATIAMSASGMAEMAPGRFCLGLGAGSAPIVERWNGGTFDQPLQRVRDVTTAVRAILTGNRVELHSTTFDIRGFRLSRPPEVPVKIFLGALQRNMLRTAGELADGALLNWLSPQDVPTALREISLGLARGRATTASDATEFEVGARLFVWPTRDREAAVQAARRKIAGYLTVPTYRAFHDWLGRREVLAPMQKAWSAGDRRAATESIPDHVIDELFIIGSPSECREKVRAYVAAGVTLPILEITLPATGATDPFNLYADSIRALAPE